MKDIIGSVVTEKPELYKLVDAVEKVEQGKWVLAPFQRPDVWKLKQQKALLQSLISGIPIGNFILKDYHNLQQEVRNVPGIDYGDKSNINAIIIDGQQRLSFLTWLKKKMLNEDFSHGPEHLFYYNLLTGEINHIEKRKKSTFFLKNDDSKNVIAKNIDDAINEFKIQFKLDVGSSEISKDDKDSKKYWDDNDYLDNKEVIINNFFDNKYHTKVGNSIKKWDEKDFENKEEFLDAQREASFALLNLVSIFTEERIIVVRANKNCDEEFGFKLYEVVNKSGIKLKGIDYIDGALYQICPNLFEEVNKARQKLSKIPFYMPGNISFEEKDLYKSIFSRANFSRCIIDELYNTPNPEDRENENSELNKLMKFGKAVDINGNKLNSKNVLDAFNKVYDSFKTIKSILQMDLKFGNLKGVNPTFMIPANALFRAIKKSEIDQIQKGRFIRWFILFHINEKPYLGGQDLKILNDCNAARNKDFDCLEKNLCKNLTKDDFNDIKFCKETYLNINGKNITSFEKISKNTENFLEKVHKFIAICEHAKDWRMKDPINTYPTGHIDAHHIFPKNLWDKDISPEERRRRDTVGNKVHIHYNTNRHKDFKKEPINYLQKYLDRSKDDFEKQQIPIEKPLWNLKNYDQFILRRIELLSNAGNKLLDKLNTGKWNVIASKTNCETIDEIEKTSNDEGWVIEFKPYFRLFQDKLNDKYSCVVFKEICAFLNTRGGDLWIGISDQGKKIGLSLELNKIKEKLKNDNKDHSDRSARDKFFNDFTNKLNSQLPKDEIKDNIYYEFVECNGQYFFKVQVFSSLNDNIPLKKYYTFKNGNTELKYENKIVDRIGDQTKFRLN